MGHEKSDPLKSWASKTPTIGRRCHTCRYFPEARDTIHRFLEMLLRRETSRSLQQLYDDILAPSGYDRTYGGMMKHVNRCERDTYAKIREQEGRE